MRILDTVRGIGRPARGRILAGLRDVIVSGRLCREPMGVCGADGCQAITPRAHISSLLDETDVPQRLPNASVEHILTLLANSHNPSMGSVLGHNITSWV